VKESTIKSRRKFKTNKQNKNKPLVQESIIKSKRKFKTKTKLVA
jgi:hypothetical protein